ASGVLSARDRLLGVVNSVVGVFVSGLVDGRVQLLASDQIALVGRAVVANERDVAWAPGRGEEGLGLLSGDDPVLGNAPVNVDAAQVGNSGQRRGRVVRGALGVPVLRLVGLDVEGRVLALDDLVAALGAVARVERGQVAFDHRDRARTGGVRGD